MTYPDNCLRGIWNERHVMEDGLVDSSLFFFTEDCVRSTGEFEQSINWEDDGQAIPFTLSQKKQDDTPQFKGGVAVIARADLDRLSKLRTFGEALSYDRQPLPENAYHGNLILAGGISKPRRKLMAATIAMHVCRIVRQPHI